MVGWHRLGLGSKWFRRWSFATSDCVQASFYTLKKFNDSIEFIISTSGVIGARAFHFIGMVTGNAKIRVGIRSLTAMATGLAHAGSTPHPSSRRTMRQRSPMCVSQIRPSVE